MLASWLLTLLASSPLLACAAALEKRQSTQASFYSSLVVFGASYNDNAHPRDAQYANTLRNYYPYDRYGGRFCNGPVAVEQMVSAGVLPTNAAGFQLIDYAYGGSHIDNSLTGGSAPSTKDQVAQYLTAMKTSSTFNNNGGRIIHYVNTGINPLTVIWNNAVSAGLTATAKSNAQAQVTANVQALMTALRSINSNGMVTRKARGRDFLIVGVPPLETVPTFAYQHGDAASLQFLKVLSDQFNDALASFARQFSIEVKDGRVQWYDMRPLFYDAYARPANYGITASPVTKTCYDSSSGAVCTNPTQYLYFDTLHPVTSFHSVWAQQMLKLIRSARSA